MISRRLPALALSLLAFVGCHEDPTVESILVQPTTEALALSTAGGNASSSSGVDGVGGAGGAFRVTTNGLISLGSPAFVPGAPAVPAAPTVFASEPASPLPVTTTVPGSIHLTGSLATAALATVTVTSSNGDIVVDGTLQSAAVGAGQTNIVLQAPNGTVYVSGTIRTAGIDSASNGQSGGNLTISAARVVITGRIDTHGVANTTAAPFNGGKGGDVDVTSSQGPIFFTAGSIVTSGGAGTDTANTASLQGGAGGFVHLTSAANAVYVFAPLTTTGGAMTGNGLLPTGGVGGSVTIVGAGEVDLLASVSMAGGAATGTTLDAVGGAGGTLKVDGPAVFKFYGSVVTAGGAAVASGTGGTVTGGLGGDVLLGQSFELNSVEIGSGVYTHSGGSGGLSTGTGGGVGGAVAIESFDGDITIASSISVAGGAATGTGNASGGAAGNILIRTDAQSGVTLSNHVLSIASLSSLLDAAGGAALGTGTGGAGGPVLLQSGGDLTCGARIVASGGSSVSGTGGSAPVGAVLIQVDASGITATGDLHVTGTIDAAGGLVSVGGTGGNGSDVTIKILAGNGALTSSATINASGSNGGLGAGGNPGNLFLSAFGGDLNLSGVLTVNGSNSPLTPKPAGNVTIVSDGVLQSSAAINAVGGSSTDATGVHSGQKGGAILFDGTGPLSSVTLLPGSSLLADGGTTIASSVGFLGGAGGSVTLQTRGRAIDMSGSLLARGGAATGTGTGGIGGQVIVVSDFLGGGVSGDITLRGAIDASGGGGSVIGVALQNLGGDPGTALVLPISVAVIFDANGGTGGAAGTTVGRITNLGSITATGSTGGDIYYNGLNSLGGTLTVADGTGLNFSGTVPGHFYPH